MKLITTGSAPISASVMDFLKIGLLTEMVEGACLKLSLVDSVR